MIRSAMIVVPLVVWTVFAGTCIALADDDADKAVRDLMGIVDDATAAADKLLDVGVDAAAKGITAIAEEGARAAGADPDDLPPEARDGLKDIAEAMLDPRPDKSEAALGRGMRKVTDGIVGDITGGRSSTPHSRRAPTPRPEPARRVPSRPSPPSRSVADPEPRPMRSSASRMMSPTPETLPPMAGGPSPGTRAASRSGNDTWLVVVVALLALAVLGLGTAVVVVGIRHRGPGAVASHISLQLPDGTLVPANRDAYTLGRSEDCDLVFADPTVSSQHAHITYSGGHALLVDAGSSNGTLVNGTPVAGPTELRQGDTLKLGNTTLRVG